MSPREAAEHAAELASARLGSFEQYGFMCALLLGVVIHQAWHSWWATLLVPLTVYFATWWPLSKDYDAKWEAVAKTPFPDSTL